jgi:hypothetical protein
MLVYQIRYDQIHSRPLKIFPSMIQFAVDEINKVVIIRAVINTYQNPDKTYLKI